MDYGRDNKRTIFLSCSTRPRPPESLALEMAETPSGCSSETRGIFLQDTRGESRGSCRLSLRAGVEEKPGGRKCRASDVSCNVFLGILQLRFVYYHQNIHFIVTNFEQQKKD